MLLEKRADVKLKNTHDQSPLDQAIDYMQNDVACVMLKHKRSELAKLPLFEYDQRE